ncbi:MAG TPA: aminoglycoside phosphotransferase family protein [Acidimicrobiales bacterium]|nr:aminoglycoside phosphotransferase family protein [Acidimicrobiales bacterium]
MASDPAVGSPDEVVDWPSARAVASLFALGDPIGPMAPVGRARSNRVFRLRTQGGTFAVKERLDLGSDPGWEADLEQAWALELRAGEAGVSIPLPVPNPDEGGPLGWVPRLGGGADAGVRVHHWVAGSPCPPGPVSAKVARWAGTGLARIHGLGVVPPEPAPYSRPEPPGEEAWAELVRAAEVAGVFWAPVLRPIGALVAGVRERARAAPLRPDAPVLTHGRLDQDNVVLGARGVPFLCDWDRAGLRPPAEDLAVTALNLGAWTDFDTVRVVLGAYGAAGGPGRSLGDDELAGVLSRYLDQLVFNIERAVGLRPAPPEVARRSSRAVPALIDGLGLRVEVARRIHELLG